MKREREIFQTFVCCRERGSSAVVIQREEGREGGFLQPRFSPRGSSDKAEREKNRVRESSVKTALPKALQRLVEWGLGLGRAILQEDEDEERGVGLVPNPSLVILSELFAVPQAALALQLSRYT